MSTLDLEQRAGVTIRERRASPVASAAILAVFGASPAFAASQRALRVQAPHTAAADEWRVNPEEGKLLSLPMLNMIDVEHATPTLGDEDPATTLNNALAFADMVSRVLPIDEEMDRRAEMALAKHASSRTRRKLTRK